MKHIFSALLFWCIAFSFSFAQITWERADAGLEGDQLDANIHITNKGVLYFAANEVLWESKDQGTTWQVTNPHPPRICFIDSDSAGNLYIGYAAIHKSSDGGKSWQLITPPVLESPTSVLHLKEMIVDDDGTIWTKRRSLDFNESYQYHISKDQGKSFQKITEGAFFFHTSAINGLLFRVNKNLYSGWSGSNMKEVYRSNNGNDWSLILTVPELIDSFVFGKDGLLTILSTQNKLYRSLDKGESWANEIPAPLAGCVPTCDASIAEDNLGQLWIYNNTQSKRFISSDKGKTWIETTKYPMEVTMRDVLGNQFWVSNGIWRIRANSTQQELVFHKKGTAAVSSLYLKAKQGTLYYDATYMPPRQYLRLSYPQKQWTSVSQTELKNAVNTYSTLYGNVMLTDDKRIVLLDANGGIMSTLIPALNSVDRLLNVDQNGEIVVAHYSTNTLKRYQILPTKTIHTTQTLDFPCVSNKSISCQYTNFYVKGGWIGNSGFYQSSNTSRSQYYFYLNKGITSSWTELDLTDINTLPLSSLSSLTFEVLPSQQMVLYNNSNDQLFVSQSDYNHWKYFFPEEYKVATSTFLLDAQRNSWVLGWRKKDLIVDLDKYEDLELILLHSKDLGKTWTERASPANGYRIANLFYDDKRYVYLSSVNGTYRTDTQLNNLSNSSSSVPESFATHAAFPNPFSNRTTLSVSLAQAGKLSVVVYNALGQRIHTLSDTEMPAGMFKFDWDASSLPSGVYFARIEANGNTKTEKLVVMR